MPVVAITAYDVAYPRGEAMEAMCDEYMSKPIDFVRLKAVLQRILR
jgi:CheY-like chemotaxis protein